MHCRLLQDYLSNASGSTHQVPLHKFHCFRSGIQKSWNDGCTVLLNTLDTLTEDDMEKTVTLYGKELRVIEALHQALTHFSYHVGQIVIIARSLTGDDWQTLSIAKGKSADYNKNPT